MHTRQDGTTTMQTTFGPNHEETVEQIQEYLEDHDTNESAFLREAARMKLQQEEYINE